MDSWKASILEETSSFLFSKEEYDYLITSDLLPRIGKGEDFIGFYVHVDTLLELLNEDIEFSADEFEDELLKGLIKKLVPFVGKNFFLP